LLSRTVADSCADPPGTSNDESGATTTEATAGGVTAVGCSLPPPHDALRASTASAAARVFGRVNEGLCMKSEVEVVSRLLKKGTNQKQNAGLGFSAAC
jgi:hypothetical protein